MSTSIYAAPTTECKMIVGDGKPPGNFPLIATIEFPFTFTADDKGRVWDALKAIYGEVAERAATPTEDPPMPDGTPPLTVHQRRAKAFRDWQAADEERERQRREAEATRQARPTETLPRRPEYDLGASRMPAIVEGRTIQVKARWSRPPWCRDDWCKVALPNGYTFYIPTERVEFGIADTCWVRASHCWDIRGGGEKPIAYEVRFLDCDGEGSLDSVSVSLTREIAESSNA